MTEISQRAVAAVAHPRKLLSVSDTASQRCFSRPRLPINLDVTVKICTYYTQHVPQIEERRDEHGV